MRKKISKLLFFFLSFSQEKLSATYLEHNPMNIDYKINQNRSNSLREIGS